MENSKILSLALLVIGVVMVISGIAASDSIGSTFSRLFTGAPTDKTVWLLVGGAITSAIGLTGLLRSPRS